MKKRQIVSILLGLILLFAIIGAGVYYYKLVKNPQQTDKFLTCTVIIEYGSLNNNSREEHHISIKEGSTAFDAFSEVAELEVLHYPFGVYIKAVNGFEEQLPNYWAFYHFDKENSIWIYSEVGVSNYYLHQEDKVKLSYTG